MSKAGLMEQQFSREIETQTAACLPEDSAQNRKNGKSNGVALLTTVLFLFTLSVMGATFLMLMQFDLLDFDAQKAELEAQYLSESGIQKGLWYLNNFTYGELYLSVQREEGLPPENPKGTFKILPVHTETDPFPLTAMGKVAGVNVETAVLVKRDRPGTPELDFTFVDGSWTHRFVKEQ